MNREALVVGINRYPFLKDTPTSQARHLRTPAEDAEAIAKILETYGNFRVERLPTCNQEGAWRVDPNPAPGQSVRVTDLKEAIAKLFNPPSQSIPDTAVLFFAGHGLRDRQGGVSEGFLATSEACPAMGQWGVSLRWLRELLQSSPVRQQIVWLDCCYSGELLNFDEADPGNLGIARDRCLIAASREFEVAYEEFSGNHGVLTNALLSALNPQQHPDGWVTNYSLVDFIRQQLQTSRQRPIFHNIGSEIILTGKKEKIDHAVLMAGVCPYKGLTYFDFNQEDPKYFYGRTALTDQLLEKVRNGNFLAVLGASGSGKSSVVRAGLLHQLKLGQRLGGSDQWVIRIFRPGEHPLDSLAMAFAKDENFNTYLKTRLTNAKNSINQGAVGLKNLIQTTARDRRLVLVVDQFEEAFTLCQDEAQRKQFFDCLLGALEITNNQLCVILTMRADFFGKCAEQDYAGLASVIQEHLVTVTPMNQKELEQAITEPAKKVGLEVQRELVAQMLSDVEGPGSLPLLEYTLTEMWRQRQVDRLMLAEYSRLGGVKGTLQKRADEVYQSLSAEEKLAAKRIFLELTQLGEGTEDTRRQVFKTDLVNEQQSAALVEEVLSKLADARLVVTSELKVRGEGEKTVTVVDVAHEALIRHWSLLRKWVNENREAIRRERKIEEAAEEWKSQGKPKDMAFLLQGAKLVEAETFLLDYSDLGLLSSLAQEFVQVSKAERDRHLQQEEQRQQRELEAAKKLAQESEARRKAAQTRNIGLGISGIVLAGLAIVAFIQARKAERQSLIAQTQTSEASLGSNKQLEALLAAVQAGRQIKDAIWEPTPDLKQSAIATLQQAVYGVQERNRLIGHGSYINVLTFSPDGEMIASASNERTKLWSREGKLLKTLPYNSSSISFSRDGKMIVSGSYDRIIRLWSREGKLLRQFPEAHKERINGIGLSPDGQIIASGSNDKTIKLWSREGQLLKTLPGHNQPVRRVSFSPDGQMIASISTDETIKLWSREGKLLHTFSGCERPDKCEGKEEDDVTSVSFSPDGQIIASGGYETVKLWSRDGQLLKTLPGRSNRITSVSFSPDGKTIASSSQDRTVKLWSIDDGQLLKTLYGHSSVVSSISFSPDGKTLASASWDLTIKLWSLDAQELQTLTGHTEAVNSVSFSPDGKTIASGSNDDTIKLWSRDGQLLKTLSGHTKHVSSVSFSPDGQMIASGGDDNTIKLWSRDGQILREFPKEHTERINSISFSPDGKTIASGSNDKTVKLWSRDGQLLKTLPGHKQDVKSVSFSPDGKMIASGSDDNTIKLWSRDGQLIKTLSDHISGLTSVSFSPDGKTLASASQDSTVKLWSLDSQKPKKTLIGHGTVVTSVTFSPDGKTLASASIGTVKLWTRDGQELKTLTRDDNGLSSVSFSPDGKTLASASWDKKVILWNLDLDDLLGRGCDWLRDYLKNPNNGLDEKDDRRRICDGIQPSAPLLVEQGRNLAKEGDIEGAVARFQKALELDQSLKFDPKAEARRFTALFWLDKGESLVKEGKVGKAIAAYTEAQKLDPTRQISAPDWNSLCWQGSLHGYAKDVMFACEKAVALAPEDGMVRDSRGLARALTGNKKGAIEDFQAFSKWAEKNEKYKDDKAQRQRWIATIRAGKNPFTPEEIKRLLNK